MEKRKQFTFYWSFYDALMDLPPEQAQQAAWAIVTYGLTGELPDMVMEPSVKVAFKLIKPVLDAAKSKSDAIIESNKRRAKKKTVQCGSNAVPITDQEKENEIENEVENEIEIENEKESLLHMGSVPLVCERDCFEKFWDAYPLKLGKKQAWLAWKREDPDLDPVMSALSCWKRSRKWQAEDGRYIPRADKFLEERHYLEPPKGVAPMGASGHLGKAELEAIELLMRD